MERLARLRERGDDFDSLSQQWVIFIMEDDPFGDRRGVYLYERQDVLTGRSLSDGTHILYVNGA